MSSSKKATGKGKWCAERLIDVAPLAMTRAMTGLALTEPYTNLLSAIGNAISFHAKRLILQQQLEANDWNLTQTAKDLGLGTPGCVLRAIRDLRLQDELEQARRDGLVTRAWNKKRAERKSL